MNYTSLLIHVVFSTKNRENTLQFKYREELFRYMKGIVNNLNCHPLAINGMSDHVHIFVDLRPSLSVSDFVKTIKHSSGNWIRSSHNFWSFKGWQEGYFAGSVGPDGKERCKRYIYNQGEHHGGRSFLAEMEWLKLKYEIEDKFNATPKGVEEGREESD